MGFPMNTLSLLLSCLAINVVGSSFEELQARAARCPPYASNELHYCPTATQFCSKFLRTNPPVPTSTPITTVTVNTTTTTTVYTTTITTTSTSNIPTGTCDSGSASKRDLAARASPTRTPTAFGPSCNVDGIPATRIESACSCLPSFTYKGRRPPATTTVVASTSTLHSTTVLTSTVSTSASYTTNVPYFMLVPVSQDPQDLDMYTGPIELYQYAPGNMSFAGNENQSQFQRSPNILQGPKGATWNAGVDDTPTPENITYYEIEARRTDGLLYQASTLQNGGYEPLKCQLSSLDMGCSDFTCTFASDQAPVNFFFCRLGNYPYLFAGDTTNTTGLTGCVAITLMAEHYVDRNFF